MTLAVAQVDSGLVSVVVVNWNGKHYIAECLESVALQSYVPRELIVSRLSSVEFIRLMREFRISAKKLALKD